MNTIKTVIGLSAFIVILACSKNENKMNNPLLTDYNTPYNSVPFDKIETKHFVPAFEELLKQGRNKVDQIINNPQEPTFENTIVALERSGYDLNRLSNILFNLNVAETNDSIQDVTKEVSPMLSEYSNDIILNEDLFAKIKTVYDNTDRSKLSVEDAKLLTKTYDDFVRNGANLSDNAKTRYREVSMELAKLSIEFGDNVLSETNDYYLHITNKADLAGLPEANIEAAAADAKARELDGWVITLQYPSFGPFLKYADKRELRKEITLAYGKRGLKENDYNNTELIKKTVSLRLELANILGYDTYADFVLSNRMAEGTGMVNTFLNKLVEASVPAAKQDYAETQEFANSLGVDFELQSWDWSYYTEKLKTQKFDINDEITRPYFKLENVEKGVLGLATTLYGITFKENKDIPVYHPDVKAFEVFDKNNKFLSLLYIDYFPRASKKGGAWMTEYLPQYQNNDGTEVRPHISLVCNFTKPTETKPSLLTFTEVTTLLHEFGHGLHGMLSQCKYAELGGTNVYRDFVELPSQIMENWAEQEEWLNTVAVHYETGEAIPQEVVDKIIASKNFLAGYLSSRQLSFALTDMKWHSLTEPFTGDVIAFEKDAMDPVQVVPEVDGLAMSPAFSHIFAGGYAAGYYSYKWAEVLDADAFALFKQKGIFDQATAQSFRENILERGGTEHPMELYKRFRGQEPSIDALLERSGLKM